MLRHLLFWLLPPITLYFPTYTYFRQFWVKSQRSITLNNSKTRNGRVHICHSTRCWKSHLASDNYDSRARRKIGRNIITVSLPCNFAKVAHTLFQHISEKWKPLSLLQSGLWFPRTSIFWTWWRISLILAFTCLDAIMFAKVAQTLFQHFLGKRKTFGLLKSETYLSRISDFWAYSNLVHAW